MADLASLRLTLSDIDLGAIDAESDHNLDSHFVPTSYASDILDARHEHILGRKGSGKSALFRQIERVIPEDTIVGKIIPGDRTWSLLRKYEDVSNPNKDSAFFPAWQYILSLLVAQTIINDKRQLSLESQKALGPVRKFVEENFPQSVDTPTAVRSFLKRVQSLNVEALGFGTGLSWNEDETNEAATWVSEKIMSSLEPLFRERGVVITLDQLDDSWDGQDASKAMMIGLLRASKRLNDRFGFRKVGEPHLRILTFMRSDIYDSLAFDDKDKHRPLEHPIIWNRDSLAAMVNARLPEDVMVDDLFAGGMRGDGSPFNHIVSRTFMRPREVLQFLGEALKDSTKTGVSISGDSIRSAEDRYSTWKIDDLKQEYSKSDSNLPSLLECLRQGRHRYDSLSDLEETIEARAPKLLDPPEVTTRTLAEKLFDYSVIGVRVGNSGPVRYKAETPQLTLPAAGQVYVHPSLHKGLLIKEAKRRAPKKYGSRPGQEA